MTDLDARIWDACARPCTLTDLALRARCTHAEARDRASRLTATGILVRRVAKGVPAWHRAPVPFARSRAGGGAP